MSKLIKSLNARCKLLDTRGQLDLELNTGLWLMRTVKKEERKES